MKAKIRALRVTSDRGTKSLGAPCLKNKLVGKRWPADKKLQNGLLPLASRSDLSSRFAVDNQTPEEFAMTLVALWPRLCCSIPYPTLYAGSQGQAAFFFFNVNERRESYR